MKLFVFGSSLTSSYWNGAATYYRGIYKNLAALGYEVTFAEPDIYRRQQTRDPGLINYARVIVYQPGNLEPLLAQAAECSIVIKHSGIGAEDELLEAAVLRCRSGSQPIPKIVFWDVDAPATLARVEADLRDPFRRHVPEYDLILTYGGEQPVVRHYLQLGGRNCHPIYNALDPDTHFPEPPDSKFACDLAFVGHRLPDREARVEKFFLRAAQLAPDLKFLLGGEGWATRSLPPNVRWIGHVSTDKHNRLNCSARMVLNINRACMADVGFSPPTRVFEAAGAGACVITDDWAGIETFFVSARLAHEECRVASCELQIEASEHDNLPALEVAGPDRSRAVRDLPSPVGSAVAGSETAEILVASSAEDVVHWLRAVSPQQARGIGARMRARALREHTYSLRAAQVDALFRAQFESGAIRRRSWPITVAG